MTDKGFTEKQMFDKFSREAQFVGGGCYRIAYFGREIFNTCTLKLRKEWEACFVKRDGKFYYS